jgi:hypothetical protein
MEITKLDLEERVKTKEKFFESLGVVWNLLEPVLESGVLFKEDISLLQQFGEYVDFLSWDPSDKHHFKPRLDLTLNAKIRTDLLSLKIDIEFTKSCFNKVKTFLHSKGYSLVFAREGEIIALKRKEDISPVVSEKQSLKSFLTQNKLL